MADIAKTNTLNAKGHYYVDTNCICCHVCALVAPSIFCEDEENLLMYVKKQPKTRKELELVQQAINECPTGSIGRV